MTAAFVMTQNFKDGFAKFQAAVGGDDAFKVYIREGYRLLTDTLYKWTAPPTAGNKGGRGGKKGGMAMVEASALNVFGVREAEYLFHLSERFGGNEISSGVVSAKTGLIFSKVKLNPFDDLAAMANYHQSRRNPRTGRTYATRPTYDKKGANVTNRMLVTKHALDAHIKAEQRKVGKLKAGWMTALRDAQSKLPDPWSRNAASLPGMSGAASGESTDAIDYPNWSGYWEAANTTPYMRDETGIVKRAAEHVERFYFKGGKPLEGFLDRMIKKHSQVPA